MCCFLTSAAVKHLEEHRAEYEGIVCMKQFVEQGEELQNIMVKTPLTYLRGKVYFDEHSHKLAARVDTVPYMTGFHASAYLRIEPKKWHTRVSDVPVMLAEITATERVEFTGKRGYFTLTVVGRIMLIMTDADLKQFLADTSTKPLDLQENEVCLEPWHA